MCGGRRVASWLGFAASPSFAAMAWVAVAHASPVGFCAAGSSGLPVDGMGAMYLLMSLFHLSPWLALISGRV
jgi:hypothetical protein